MNQFLLLCVFTIALTTSFSVTAQVGIGTADPKETLHVAGDDSTIRIDGLNSTNNPNNDGLNNTVVAVDADGNMVLERPIFDRYVNEEDFLPATDFVDTQIKYGTAHKIIYNYQVTTADKAKLLFVGYQIGVLIREAKDPIKKLNQTHQQKLYGLAIVINENTTVTQAELDTGHAVSANYFAADNKYFDGVTYLSGQAMVRLEANKTYYFHLVGYIRNGDDDSGIRTTYGGNGNLDRFQLFELY